LSDVDILLSSEQRASIIVGVSFNEQLMHFVGKVIASAVVAAGVLASSQMNASAEIICNDEGVCWHTHNPYDYPLEAHVTIHDNEWHWGPNEHYTFREHAGRGYWKGDTWIGW